MPFLTFLSTVVATEGGVASDIPPTLWCLDESCKKVNIEIGHLKFVKCSILENTISLCALYLGFREGQPSGSQGNGVARIPHGGVAVYRECVIIWYKSFGGLTSYDVLVV